MGIAEFIIGPANGRTRWLHPSCRSVAAPLGHWPTTPQSCGPNPAAAQPKWFTDRSTLPPILAHLRPEPA